MGLNPRPFFFRPVHRANVERGVPIELTDSFMGEFDPSLDRDYRLQIKLRGGFVDPSTVEFEIGRNTFEPARAIEDHRAEPCGMRTHAHNWVITFVPCTLVMRPRLRVAFPKSHSNSPSRAAASEMHRRQMRGRNSIQLKIV